MLDQSRKAQDVPARRADQTLEKRYDALDFRTYRAPDALAEGARQLGEDLLRQRGSQAASSNGRKTRAARRGRSRARPHEKKTFGCCGLPWTS